MPLHEIGEIARNDYPPYILYGHKSNRISMNEETEELDDGLVNIKGDVAELTGGKVSIMEDAD